MSNHIYYKATSFSRKLFGISQKILLKISET